MKTKRFLATLLCLLMLASCTQMNDAEKKASAELKALQSSDSVGSEVINLRSSLSDEGKAHFDGFLAKLRDFDFEITGTFDLDANRKISNERRRVYRQNKTVYIHNL